MARPNTNYHRKKIELIQFVFDLFMEKGYENTTISDILKVANISKGAMYHYFESKEDILDAVLHYIIELDAKSSNEVRQAVEHTKVKPVSIFGYRARELSRECSVPILAKIMREVEALSFLVVQCLNIDEVKAEQFGTHLKQQIQNFLQQ